MAKFGIGQSVRRVEDPRLLTGGGRYTDDTKLDAPAFNAKGSEVAIEPLEVSGESLTVGDTTTSDGNPDP